MLRVEKFLFWYFLIIVPPKMDKWRGRVAVVTGASEGIGADIVSKLVEAGMKVYGCARNLEKMQAHASSLKDKSGEYLPAKCDLNNEQEILDMFKRIKSEQGRLDVCINNAGFSIASPLLSGETESWRAMLNVNVLGVGICTREAVNLMKDTGVDDGHVININSLSGHRVLPSPRSHFYAATKFAVTAMTEGVRNELRLMKSNIRVSQISPGLVETQFAIRMSGKEAGETLYQNNPSLSAEDVSSSVLHVLSAPKHVQIHDVLMRATTAEK